MNVNLIEEYRKTASGRELFFRAWDVESPKLVIALVHGVGEHSGRYQHVADFFNARGISVYAFDEQGHGLTRGKKGHSLGIDSMMDDIEALLGWVMTEHPDVPVILYGHSGGGNQVLTYAIKRGHHIDGVIATAPQIRLAFEPPAFLLALGCLMRKIYPAFTQSNQLDLKFLSTDTSVIDAYKADPLVHDKVSSAFALGLIDTSEELDHFKGTFPKSLLLMHGAEDGITSSAASQDFANRVSGDITLKIWDGMYHEIHNEVEKEKVLAFEMQWIGKHFKV